MRACIVSAVLSLAAMVGAPVALADSAVSSNWAGYAAHHSGVGFRQVSGSWKQPGVSCAPGKQSYSAYWVGLGGFNANSNALEQIGTEADCSSSGGEVLGAWYELVPAPAAPISMSVKPGDTMQASVTVTGHRVVLTLADLTRGRAFSRAVNPASVDVSAAEWIVEAPSDCVAQGACRTLPLANFGSTTFTGVQAQATNGHTGSISDPGWGFTRVDLTPGGRRFVGLQGSGPGVGAATASLLRPGGTAFKVTYSRAAVQSNPFLYARRRLLAGDLVSSRR